MKRLLTICAIAFLLVATNAVYGGLWEIKDAGLQDTTNFVVQPGGASPSVTDIAGNPGTQFSITLSGSGWQKIQIGDGYDFPFLKSGLVAATGNASAGNTWFGDLSMYDGYTMTISNPSTNPGGFMAVLYMNTGWTDAPVSEPDRYYQDTPGWTWINPGETATLTLDFSGVENLNHVSDIGFQIGSNMGLGGDYSMPSGELFKVNVVPLPAAVLLGMLGMGAAGLKLRKFV